MGSSAGTSVDIYRTVISPIWSSLSPFGWRTQCLPRAVVRASSGDATTVKVWDGVQEISKQIKIGLRGDTYVELVSGLGEGDQVVTR